MSRADRPSSELDPLFESAKALDRVSDLARARIRARARATVAAASASTLPEASPEQRPRRPRLAFAAGMAFALGATGAAAAFLGHRSAVPRTAPTAPVPRIAPIVDVGGQNASVPPVAAPGLPVNALMPRHPRHPSRGWDARAAELALIQKAQAAYADGNLPNALQLLAEHGRRFPNGRLAEEREALRVRSLAGCGRSADARRALQAFADRYSHSVLLPHLQETLDSGTRP